MFTTHFPDCQRRTVWELVAMNVSRRRRVLVFLFSFLTDLKILAWPFAFCTVQSHESLICGSKEKHRTVYSLFLHQFSVCVSLLIPVYRPLQFRERASSALLWASVYSLAPLWALCRRGPRVLCSFWCFQLGDFCNCTHLILKCEKKLLNLGVDLYINYTDLSCSSVVLIADCCNIQICDIRMWRAYFNLRNSWTFLDIHLDVVMQVKHNVWSLLLSLLPIKPCLLV